MSVRTWGRGIAAGVMLGLLVGAVVTRRGCEPDFGPIAPGQVHAFTIPLTDSGPARDSTVCLVSVPPGYVARKCWPLVVALHGYGSNALRFHDYWQKAATEAGCVLATPQAERRTAEGIGWSWGPAAEQIVQRCVEGVAGLAHIDRRNISVIGFSQGARIALRVGLEHPHVFRGIATLGAPWHRSDAIPDLGMQPGGAHAPPLYIGHGALEDNLAQAHRAVEQLRTLGYAVRFEEYADVGHGLPEPPDVELRRILTYFARER